VGVWFEAPRPQAVIMRMLIIEMAVNVLFMICNSFSGEPLFYTPHVSFSNVVRVRVHGFRLMVNGRLPYKVPTFYML
jgi:hypothetical protein